MGQVSSQLRSLAKRLVTLEEGRKPARSTKPGAFDACERLRPQLVPLMGVGGFRALLLHALALAAPEVPWVRAIKVKEDGALELSEGLSIPSDPDILREGKVALLAQLLGLLVAFIGENLTLQLVRDAWPKARRDHLELDNGNQNEKNE